MKNDVFLCMLELKQHAISRISELLDVMNLSEFQKCDGFHIFRLEDYFDVLPKQISLFSQGYFELTLVTYSESNSTSVKVDTIDFEAAKDSLTFVAPGQSTDIDVRGTSADAVKGYMMVFTTDFISSATSDFSIIQRFPFFNIRFSPVHYLAKGSEDFVNGLFETLLVKFETLKTDDEALLKAHFQVLLLELKELLEVKDLRWSRAEKLVYEYENSIKNTAAKHQKISYYANHLNVSTVYLSECVKKVTGISAKKVMDEYIVMEAKSLLNYSSQSISEIASTLGFEEVSNFIVYFKKQVHLTPFSFRNQLSS